MQGQKTFLSLGSNILACTNEPTGMRSLSFLGVSLAPLAAAELGPTRGLTSSSAPSSMSGSRMLLAAREKEGEMISPP